MTPKPKRKLTDTARAKQWACKCEWRITTDMALIVYSYRAGLRAGRRERK